MEKNPNPKKPEIFNPLPPILCLSNQKAMKPSPQVAIQ